MHEKSRMKVCFESVTSVNQLDGVYALACDGFGICQLPIFMGQDARGKKELEQVLPEWDIHGNRKNTDCVFALFTGGEKMTAKVRVFIDFLVTELSSGPVI